MTGLDRVHAIDVDGGDRRACDAGVSLDRLMRGAAAARLVRAGHARAPATSPSAARSPPTSTARTTTRRRLASRDHVRSLELLHRRRRDPRRSTPDGDARPVLGHGRRHGPDRRRRSTHRPAAAGRDVADAASTPNAPPTSTTDGADGRRRRRATATRSPGSTAWRAARRWAASVLTRGDHAPLDELPATPRRDPLRVRAAAARCRAPPWVPNGLLNRADASRAFNELWFRKAPARERGRLAVASRRSSTRSTACADWNRIYGPRGFVQYQFVVPFGREDGAAAGRRAAQRAPRAPSFLAVLKRFGPGDPGPLSFPMPGWTLALDIPAGAPGLAGCSTSSTSVVAGGRRPRLPGQGLAPAARAARPACTPARPSGADLRAEVDPRRVFTSDLPAASASEPVDPPAAPASRTGRPSRLLTPLGADP